jgi:RNA polymerase sigma-70 factor (ECF subfamily)
VTRILANRLARTCAYSTRAPEWDEFVSLVSPVISLAAWRVARVWGEAASAPINEIVQDVFLKLCEDNRRILRDFEDRGSDSFLKLLRVITASVSTDYFRRMHAEKRGGSTTTVTLDTPGVVDAVFDTKATAAVEWPALIAQLDNLLRLLPDEVTERDRNLFWLYYRQGLTAEAISRIPAMGLSAKGVESALLRLARLLRETIRDGKPKPQASARQLVPEANGKGFSQVVAINSVKRR